MASAYSTPKQFDNYVAPVNLELVNFVLGAKEQKFNYNVAKVEQTLQDFGDLGLVRGQDKEYLADRVNTMLTQMGDIENMDWSDSNIERQITSGIRGAIDGKVRKDIQMSRQYTNYVKEAQKMKEEDPERYSDVNFVMGLRNSGAEAWLNDGAEEFGNLEFSPYINVKENKTKFVSDFIKIHGDERVEEVTQPDGTVKVITKKGLSRDQVASLYDANMTPEEQRQLQMEADYNFGSRPPVQQQAFLQAYDEDLRQESKTYKDEAERIRVRPTNSKEEEQRNISRAENLEAQAALIEEQVGKVKYADAYRDAYGKSVREDIIRSNAFEKTTKIETNLDKLRAIKLRAEITKLGNEASKQEQTASGSNLRVTADGGIDASGENAVVDHLATQTITEMDEATTGLVRSFTQEAENDPEGFYSRMGIEASTFNKKSKQEKESLIAEKFDEIDENGVNLNGKGFSPSTMNAYQRYKSSQNSFESVNKGVKKASDTVAKKALEGMIAGVANGGFNVDNFRNKTIRDVVKRGRSYDELKGDEKNAFRVAMIDESIREGYIEEPMIPYVLQNRKELLDSIEDDNIRGEFSSEEAVQNSQFGSFVDFTKAVGSTIWNTVTSGIGGTGSQRNIPEIAGSVSQALEAREEFRSRGVPSDIGITDQDFGELGSRWLNKSDFIVDGEETNASVFIQSQYDSALKEVSANASETASRVSSNYVISLSSGIKEEKEIRDRALSAITLNSQYSTNDFQSDDVEVRYDKKTGSIQYTANLKATVVEDDENRRVSSNPIPIAEEANVVPSLTNRIKTDDGAWYLNSDNPSAESIKFRTRGFENSAERKRVLENLPLDVLGEETALGLLQSPGSIGYTSSDLEEIFEEHSRQTPNGTTKRFVEEFPRLYERLTTGQGEFVVNYEPRKNQGYFMTIDYMVGDNSVNIVPPTQAGREIKYEEKVFESLQRQRELIEYMAESYLISDKDMIAKLKEIEKL